MTKEELLKEFLMDDLVEQKGYMTKEEVAKHKYIDLPDTKLVNVIKFAILEKKENDTPDSMSRRLNQTLNK